MNLLVSPAASDLDCEGTAASCTGKLSTRTRDRVGAASQQAMTGCSGASARKWHVCPSKPILGVSAPHCTCLPTRDVLVGTRACARQGHKDQSTIGSHPSHLRPVGSRIGHCLHSCIGTIVNKMVPNLSLNRTRYGMAPWPRGYVCTSSASRPGRHACAGRLALR